MQASVSLLVERRVGWWRVFVPFFLQREPLLVSAPGYTDVGWIEVAVADNADLVDAVEFLVHQLEERTAEVPRDPQVGSRIFKPVAQENM
jgi:hypothetical protein